MSYFTDALDPQHLDLLTERFLGGPVRAEKQVEGQSLDGRTIVLGCKTGPLYHISGLTHEMCHLAELPVERIVKRPRSGWGFTYGKYWEVCGKSGYESQTDQSVRREMRVWAFQWNLHQELKLPCHEEPDKNTLRHLVSSSRYMDAFFLYKLNVLTEEQRKDYRDAEERTIDIMADEVLRLSQTEFTYARFVQEWQSRVAALETT